MRIVSVAYSASADKIISNRCRKTSWSVPKISHIWKLFVTYKVCYLLARRQIRILNFYRAAGVLKIKKSRLTDPSVCSLCTEPLQINYAIQIWVTDCTFTRDAPSKLPTQRIYHADLSASSHDRSRSCPSVKSVFAEPRNLPNHPRSPKKNCDNLPFTRNFRQTRFWPQTHIWK